MKRLTLILLMLVALTLVGSAVLAGEKAEGKEVTLTGEVLDLYCYMQHPKTGTGPEHAKCAKNCINKGLPIGFLADGVVYTIIGSDHESAADMVAGFTGRKSTIKGKLIEHDGVKAIELFSIAETK